MSIPKLRTSFVYRTLIIRRLCKQANAPDAIESRINEFLELVERKYINGDPVSFFDLIELDEERLKTSFPSSEDQIIDLAERLHLPLTTYSALQGYTCLMKQESDTVFFTFLIKSPHLKSTNALTFLYDIIEKNELQDIKITYVGTMKAYNWLNEKTRTNIFHSISINYLIKSIVYTGTLDEFLYLNRIFIGTFDLKSILQTFKHNKWIDISRIPIILFILSSLEKTVDSHEQFIQILNEFLILVITTRIITKNEKHVLISLFDGIKVNFNNYILEDITIFSRLLLLSYTPFFLHLWLFENYHIPLQDPIDQILSNHTISYIHDYFLYFKENDDFNIFEYIELNRNRLLEITNDNITKNTSNIIKSCILSQHNGVQDLNWFISIFNLHYLVVDINGFLMICLFYVEGSNTNGIIPVVDTWENTKQIYKWLIYNGAYKPIQLSTSFTTKETNRFLSCTSSHHFAKLLQLGEYKIDQDLVNDVATTYLEEDGKLNYQLLASILHVCISQNKINEIRFPDSICFSTMITDDMLHLFISFLNQFHLRKLTKSEVTTFMEKVDVLLLLNYDFIKKMLDPDIIYDYVINKDKENHLFQGYYYLNIIRRIWPDYVFPSSP